MLSFSVILVQNAYADVSSVETDDDSYQAGNDIIFSGTASGGDLIVLEIYSPVDNKIIVKTNTANDSGSFELSVRATDILIHPNGEGIYTVYVYELNSQGKENALVIKLNREDPNITVLEDALKLNSISKKTVDEKTLVSFTATLVKSISNVTFELANNPPTGATIESTTGKFSWTPTESQGPGTYTFDIVASDGLQQDKTTVTIEVREVTEQQTPPPPPPPEPEPDPIADFQQYVDSTKNPQYYVDRYNNEPSYKDWFDQNFPGITIYQAVGISEPKSTPPPPEPEPEPKPKSEPKSEPSPTKDNGIAKFVDPKKDPQYYVDRYNNEPSYKAWFETNYPDMTIYEAVGLPAPQSGLCGTGTKLVDGVCKVTLETKTTKGGGCLIATAAYGTEMAHQVQFLREVRDNTLLSTESGTSFMTGFNDIYYSFSPTIADWERENPAFREAVKAFITPMVSTLSIMTLADQGSEEQVLFLGISVIALNLGMYIAAPAVVAIKVRKHLKLRK
ncbi:MAG: hypothetical protein DWQ13_03275 [Crenarchaeota archaeon]|nr:MAG: hypothetical protein DWQ13_03275 [Thermoproteota archaeon]